MRTRITSRVKGVGAHPLVGGPRGHILVDSRLPPKYRKPIVFHEKYEYKLMKGGMSYKKAHRLSNKAEKSRFFKGKKRDKRWTNYLQTVRRIKERKKK